MLNIFKIIAIIGLICLTIASILFKDKYRKIQYVLWIVGGLLMETYSIYLKDIIFIILQAVFTLTSLYGLIKINNIKKK